MKIKVWIYSLLILLVMFESCGSSKRVIYFQSEKSTKGQTINLPSYRNESLIRFKPDDILGITVNVPGEPSIALDYNLPLIPIATPENSTEDYVNPSTGRQTYLIKKDGTIDYPVIGNIKVVGYTQGELEEFLKKKIMESLIDPPIVTVRLANFDIVVTGEVNRPGKYRIDRDYIDIMDALTLAGDMTIYGRRDDIMLKRQTPDGGYMLVSLDISKESTISSPYYFLQQNDVLYIKPNNARAQVSDISPSLSTVLGIGSFLMSLTTFVLMLTKK